MNAVLQLLRDRKSVRVFEERPIELEKKQAILEACMEAPSAGNQQLYTILDITDQLLKEKLADTCDHQSFIAKAPLVLIFCADVMKWLDVYEEADISYREPGTGDLLLAIEDAMIAAQNAVVAASSLGIGSCYIGDILENCEIHRELLNLPEYVVPIGMVVFGYPTKNQLERTKPKRFRLEDIVMENTYKRKDGKALREMFEERTKEKGYDEWVHAFCNRKYNSDFSKEMSRSSSEYLKNFMKEEN
ncbi:Oxygen-insensitive NADPH nitroreductase [Lachnospiraceae bacterium TWA4]|nr:Oxygen-insensitive NADPH nitroreductase [Lachnospiraceae bacterium TWA4]